MKSKFLITITFLPDPKTGELYDLIYIKLKTKAVTWKRAQEIAEHEADFCFPHNTITIKRLK